MTAIAEQIHLVEWRSDIHMISGPTLVLAIVTFERYLPEIGVDVLLRYSYPSKKIPIQCTHSQLLDRRLNKIQYLKNTVNAYASETFPLMRRYLFSLPILV